MNAEGSAVHNLAEHLKCSLTFPLWMLSCLMSGIFILTKQSQLFCSASCLVVSETCSMTGGFLFLTFVLASSWSTFFLQNHRILTEFSQLQNLSDFHRVPPVPSVSAEWAPTTSSISILFPTSFTKQFPNPPSQAERAGGCHEPEKHRWFNS